MTSIALLAGRANVSANAKEVLRRTRSSFAALSAAGAEDVQRDEVVASTKGGRQRADSRDDRRESLPSPRFAIRRGILMVRLRTIRQR
jgi:hypothetical protein